MSHSQEVWKLQSGTCLLYIPGEQGQLHNLHVPVKNNMQYFVSLEIRIQKSMPSVLNTFTLCFLGVTRSGASQWPCDGLLSGEGRTPATNHVSQIEVELS